MSASIWNFPSFPLYTWVCFLIVLLMENNTKEKERESSRWECCNGFLSCIPGIYSTIGTTSGSPPPSQPGAAYVPLQTKNLWRASHSQLSIPRRTFPVVPRAPSSIKQHCTLGLSSFRWYKLHLPPRSCIGWSWGCLFCGTWLVIRISRPGLAREYLIYYRGPGCLAVVWYDLFPLSPISKLSLFISLPVCRRLSLLTQNRFKIIRTGSKSQRNKTHGALLCAVFKLNSAFAANSILKCHLASLNISFAQ